ncbi:MAG: GNAT family N-acetyltransferase [Anaerolineaceae bacterium]|nr:GNAT family N-acetyltransferase [Anaerolineaceae bacterium]
MESFTIRPIEKEDRNWIAQFLDRHWGSTRIVTRGQVYLAHLLPGFIAEQDGEKVGLVTYRIDGEACELMTINSTIEGQGVGTALLEAVKTVAMEEGCKRLWLITTNDNLKALRFYQKRDLHIVAVYPGALDASRKVKPEIPLFGYDGIPLRDEIELEMTL